MKIKHIFKFLTFMLALTYIVSLSTYSCFIIGTLFHELNHAKYAQNLKVIEVNYDTSGVTKAGSFFRHSHEWVYFNGFVIELFMVFLMILSLIILILSINNWCKDGKKTD